MLLFVLFNKMKKFDFKRIIRYFNYHSKKKVSTDILVGWKVVSLAFFILLFVFCAVDIYLFWGYQREMNSSVKASLIDDVPRVVINKSDLSSVMAEFERRKALFEKAMKSPDERDPSK